MVAFADNIHGVDKLRDCLITADKILSMPKLKIHPRTEHEGPEGE
jgi:hypothetical protein